MKHYLGICLVLLVVAGIVLFTIHSCTAALTNSVDEVSEAFTKVLQMQPQVTVNQKVVLTQTAPVAELAVVTKDEVVALDEEAHMEVLAHSIPLTEKKLRGEATYRIKAGFDLREPFHIEVDPKTHQISATMPHAKILSVEQIGDLTYHGEDGLLNRVTDDERAKMVNDLNAAAHASAQSSSLRDDAEKEVTQRLQDILNHNGQKIQIDWTPGPRS